MRIRPYWRWGAANRPERRSSLTQLFLVQGTLYGPGHCASEEAALREECEELGLPMGYGRVQRSPVQLDDDLCVIPER